MNNNDDDNSKMAAPNQLQPQNDIDETTMAMALEVFTSMENSRCNNNESENTNQAAAADGTVCGVPIAILLDAFDYMSTLTIPNDHIDLSKVHQLPEDLSSFDPRIVDSVKKTIDFRNWESTEQHVPLRRNCGKRHPNPRVFAEATSPDAALLILIQWRYKPQEEQKELNEKYLADTDTDERNQYKEQLRVLMNIPKETKKKAAKMGDIVDGKIMVGGGNWVTLERYAEIEQLKQDAKNRIQNAVALIKAANESGRLRDLEQMYHTAYVDENNKPPVRSISDSREIREAVDNVKLIAERLEGHSSYENYHGLKNALKHVESLSPGWKFDAKYQHPVPPVLEGSTIPLVSSKLCKASTCSGHICKGDKLQLQDCRKAMVAMGFSLHPSVLIVPLSKRWYEDQKVPLPNDGEFELALSTGDILRCERETKQNVMKKHCHLKDEVMITSAKVTRDGRYQFCLRNNNCLQVSMAICYAFHGPPPDGNGWDVDHINRDTLDNRPENLRWGKNKKGGEQAMNKEFGDLLVMNEHFES